MSALTHEPTAAVVEVECPACEGVVFHPVTDPGEAAFRAGLHNQFEHGGAMVATAVQTPDTDQVSDAASEIETVVSGLGWSLAPEVYADARQQAAPYAGDQTADARAWSARVDAAVAGMDVIDPAGLDTWMATHRESDVPHLVEAGLVAAWETHIRDVYDAATGADQNDHTMTLTDETADSADLVADRDDVDDWS